MRQINAVNTLRVLYRSGALTLTKIVEATGLARTTAEAAVERLVGQGLAVELPPDSFERVVGRPARSFQFRADAGHVLGIDIGVHRVAAALADLRGSIRARSEQPVARSASRAERLTAALAAASDCRGQAGIGVTDVWATTAGTPGLVEKSAYVSLCHVLPEWSDFPLADALGTGLTSDPTAGGTGPVGVEPGGGTGSVEIENDTNLAAVAERWQGVAQDVDSLVWVLAGRRVSAAILVDGQLYRGADGAAGEIGWVPELGWSALSAHPLSFTGTEHTRAPAAATTISRAAAGDEPARRELDRFAASLAPGLTALALVLNPRCLVIGGGVASAGELLLRAVADHMRPHCLRLPDLRVSTLGQDAVALGAVRHALDRIERRLFATGAIPAQLVTP